MLPVLARELVEGHHPLPVALERTPDLSVPALRAPGLKRPLQPLGLLARRGVGDLREQTPRLGLARKRQLVEDIQQAMVPAPLLCGLGEDRGQRAPDAEMPVADHHLGRLESTLLEVAQERRPALGRFPIAALHGEDHLAAVAQGGQDHEVAALSFSRPALTYTP